MNNNVYIVLNSGRDLKIDNFKYITYPDGHGKTITVKKFDNFYLYNRLLTFVGETSIITLNSSNIESIMFNGSFND